MRHTTLAILLVAGCAVAGTAYAQEPASTDGKSVPMQQAPEKIKPAGKSKSAMHKKVKNRHMKKM